MRICLLRPNRGSRFQTTPPLSLGYLASALKKAGYADIRLVDASLDDLDPVQAYERITAEGAPAIVGIQVYTGAHRWTREFVAHAKRERLAAAIVCGGPHITALRELALQYLDVDYGVLGEGENAIVGFAGFIEGRQPDPAEVEGLLYRDPADGRYRNAKVEFGFVRDVNALPSPDWELLQPQRYFQTMQGASVPLRGRRPVVMLTSRGCPYQCTFCASRAVAKRIIRYRAPENIVREMKYLMETFRVDEIFFSDDNLTMDLNRAEKLFDLMIQEKLRLHWRAPNGIRVDRLNGNLAAKMAASGGYYVGVGVESGNPGVLKRIKKNLDLDGIPEAVRMLRKRGFFVSGFFICGLLGETREEIGDSIAFALKTPFSRIQVSNYVPYPGSEDFETIFQIHDRARYEQNVMKFQEDETIPAFQQLSLSEIYRLQRNFMLRFYLRPRVMLSILLGLRPSQIRTIFEHPWVRVWLSKIEKKWYA